MGQPFSFPRASARKAKGLPHTGRRGAARARPAAKRQAGLERLVIGGARRLAGCACTGRALPGPAAKGRKRRAPPITRRSILAPCGRQNPRRPRAAQLQ